VALETVPRLAESRIAFIEQPVGADDLEGLREVRALGVPLIADESVYSPADVLRIGRLGAADIVSVYVGKSSALERAVESARLANELGMDVVIGANGEMGIGAAAQLHVACACEQIGAIPHGIIGHHFYEDDATLATPLDIDGVVARLPDGPGLGVEPSDEVRRGFSS
jgi:L-alanine-DL-glutamate epimerase-like enolase superfamily enzyme